MSHSHLIEDIATAKDFVLAGRAVFTVKNTETGNRCTYRVDKTDTEGVFTVSAFTGSDNSVKGHYSVLGAIACGGYVYHDLLGAARELQCFAKDNGDGWLVGFCDSMINRLFHEQDLTDRQEATLMKNLRRAGIAVSDVPADDMKAKVFDWLWAFYLCPVKPLPAQVQFWHEGRCGRCNRRLTVPESITLGFGPDCAAELGYTLDAAA